MTKYIIIALGVALAIASGIIWFLFNENQSRKSVV